MNARKHFDFAFSIGSACACTQCLRWAGMQFASFPMDWLVGGSLRMRADILATDFSNWFEPEDLLRDDSEPNSPRDIYVSRKTGIAYKHDFGRNSAFSSEYPVVREKYARRIARLKERLEKSRDVLIVYLDTVIGLPTDRDEVRYALERIRGRYPRTHFTFLRIVLTDGDEPNMTAPECVSEDTFEIRGNYRDRRPNVQPWQLKYSILIESLKRFGTVRDYRTFRDRLVYRILSGWSEKMKALDIPTFGGYFRYRIVRDIRHIATVTPPRFVAKALCGLLPRGSVLGRMLRTRVVKFRNIREFTSGPVPGVLVSRFSDPDAKRAETLVFGSSHAAYSVRPDAVPKAKAWNCGVDNCDLETVTLLLRKRLSVTPSCRRVFVCLDYWQRSHQMELSSSFPIRLALAFVADVPLRRHFASARASRLVGARLSEINDGPNPCAATVCGYDPPAPCNANTVDERVTAHLKFLQHPDTELRHIAEIRRLCREAGVSLVFFSSPVRPDYRAELLKRRPDVWDEIRRAVGETPFVDGFSDDSFRADDFGDPDHLSPTGAARFTAKLLSHIANGSL